MNEPITLTIDESNQLIYSGGFVGTGGFYIRPFAIKAGTRKHGHEHWIDHVGNLVSGHARVHWRDPKTGDSGVIDMQVPAKIEIKAERWHEIEAVTDCVWECWFSKAEADRVYGDATQADWIMEKPAHG